MTGARGLSALSSANKLTGFASLDRVESLPSALLRSASQRPLACTISLPSFSHLAFLLLVCLFLLPHKTLFGIIDLSRLMRPNQSRQKWRPLEMLIEKTHLLCSHALSTKKDVLAHWCLHKELRIFGNPATTF